MLWRKRYEPVEAEQVIACDHSIEVCRELLTQWCIQTRSGASHTQSGLVVKPFGREEFRGYFQYDTAEEKNYYYKHYFLRIWLKERPDGGCDIHYQRVFDTLTGRMLKPLGVILIGTAIVWLIIMRQTTQAWVYLLSLFMVWLGVWLILPKIESRDQGAEVGNVLEQAVAGADWPETEKE